MNYNIVRENENNIRALAREALAGKWAQAMLATVVYMAAIMIPGLILDLFFGGEDYNSPLSSVYSMLVSGAFTLGYTSYCINLFRNKEISPGQVFSGFEHFLKALGLNIMTSIFVILWSLLLIVPGIIAALRYSQAYIIMVEHPEYGIFQCINESKRMMNGNKAKLFVLGLSFIGWSLLASLPIIVVTMVYSMNGDLMYDPAATGQMEIVLTSIIVFVYAPLIPYICVSEVVLYEMITGNLRPNTIEIEPAYVEAVEENHVKEETSEELKATEPMGEVNSGAIEEETVAKVSLTKPNEDNDTEQ